MVYGVKFEKNNKEYKFISDNTYKIGTSVVLDTERGKQLGVISSKFEEDTETNYKQILNEADAKDKKNYEKNKKEALEAIEKAQEIANELDLEMNFVDASFTLDRKQLLLIYTAENRIDFRILAKELASIYKTRIELRQIGIRDKAREVSGIGQCGRELCCACFLNNMESVSISMVKNQNLSLNPTKINGQCGRLLCCLNYENEVYSECRADLPKIGDEIKNKEYSGKVISLDILNKKYTIETTDGEQIEIEVCDKCEKNK